jgi:hypothetical protein
MNLPPTSRKYSNEAENVNDGIRPTAAVPPAASLPTGDTLAAVLTGLDPTARAKLAAMLIGQSAKGPSRT